MTAEANDSGSVHDDSDFIDTFEFVAEKPDPGYSEPVVEEEIWVPVSQYRARQMLPPGVYDIIRKEQGFDTAVIEQVAQAALAHVEPISLSSEAKAALIAIAGELAPSVDLGFTNRYLPDMPKLIKPEVFSGIHTEVTRHLPTLKSTIAAISTCGGLARSDLLQGFLSLDLLSDPLKFDVWPTLRDLNLFEDLPKLDVWPDLPKLDVWPDFRSLDLLGDFRFDISGAIDQILDLLGNWRTLSWIGHPKAGRAMRAAQRARRAVLRGETKEWEGSRSCGWDSKRQRTGSSRQCRPRYWRTTG